MDNAKKAINYKKIANVLMVIVIILFGTYIVYDLFGTYRGEKPVVEERNSMSDTWKSGEFKIGKTIYKLSSYYKELSDNGWSIDFEELGHPNGYVLNKNEKDQLNAKLKNNKYKDNSLEVGFINYDSVPKDAKNCQYWSITINNKDKSNAIDFELPGGIKNGTSIQEIEKTYGKPEDPDNIFRAETLKYTTYIYEYENTIYLKLTIYDEEGLTAFEYNIY